MKTTPILFLDLDGTVRLGPAELNGKFVNEPADVELFDGMTDLLKSYKERGWRIVAISNQGGIALGHATENGIARSMQETNRLCANLFDLMLWCTHHPDAKGDEFATTEEKSICFCRKPRIGYVVSAFIQLSQQHPNEMYRPYDCLFVGDMDSDKECAENANIPFMWAGDWRLRGTAETAQ